MYVTITLTDVIEAFVVVIRDDQEWLNFSAVLKRLLAAKVNIELAYKGALTEPVEGRRSGMLVLSVSTFEWTVRDFIMTPTDRAIFNK